MNHSAQKIVLGCAVALPALLLASPGSAEMKTAPERTNSYSGTLRPLNNSGVTGTFTIQQRGQGQITVNIRAQGLEVTSNPHLGHIHGPESGDAMCPTMAQDKDGDGYVELAEGQTTYGPIIVPLGDVDPNNDGIVNYSMTFNLNKSSTYQDDKGKNDLLPLEKREIVLHGMTVPAVGSGTPGEVNGEAGYKAVLPVACGEIRMNAR